MSDQLEPTAAGGVPENSRTVFPDDTVSVLAEEDFTKKPAGFWIRFWAYVIDLIVISAIGGLLVKPVFRVFDWAITNPSFLLFSPYKTVMLIVFLAYFLLMTRFFGQTAGKMICGIRVVRKTGGAPGWSSLLFREVIGRYISKTLPILYLLPAFMPNKEALHDLFADTVVVHEQLYEKPVRSSRTAAAERTQLQEGRSI